MTTVTVLGAGSWGTTLALLAVRAGGHARLWMRDPATAALMQETRTHPSRVPGVSLPPESVVQSDMATALRGAGIVVFAVPCAAMRDVARSAMPFMDGHVAVSAAKGIEVGSLLTMTQVIDASLGGEVGAICALSGPNLAREIAAGKPAASVVACRGRGGAELVAAAFGSPDFRLYTSDDVLGVELGGAMKNVIALGAGMADGLGAGDNGKAALMCRGLAEMARLGSAMGANPATLSGLAGLGDLIATCASPLSRNLRAGRALAGGVQAGEIAALLGEVAEGIPTAAAAVALGEAHGVELPIAAEVAAVIAGSRSVRDAVGRLMGRESRPELD